MTGFMIALVILSCILPMGLSPVWNGQMADHRNQYEVLAESFLHGKLYFEYDVDPRLLAMENPYDNVERDRQEVYYYWDHAFYNGHYYMYFGVAPVLLLFLPFRALTGHPLTTYHATQIFTALHILGIFAFFRLLARKFFPDLSRGLYFLLCTAVSYISVWYAVSTPALYCTAITGALCFGIFSMYAYARAVWDTDNIKNATMMAVLGALFGALEFGCRPPIGISNLVALPVFCRLVKKYRNESGLIRAVVCVALPYIIIGAGLMWYNYARFGTPFEFGQSYQLTSEDQSAYLDMAGRLNIAAVLHGFYYYLFNLNTPFHIISIGLLLSYPVITWSFAGLFERKLRGKLREAGMVPFLAAVNLSIVVIILFDVLWAPHPIPRYRMDFYWLFGISAFIIIGMRLQNDSRMGLRRAAGFLSLSAILVSIIFALYPRAGNFTSFYTSEIKAFLGIL